MAELLRYQLFLSIGIVFLSIWWTSLNNLQTIKSSSLLSSSVAASLSPFFGIVITPTTIDTFITYLPIWSILILGIYALCSVLYKVATFGDCPKAAEELSKEILDAKARLKSAGFVF